MLRLANSSFLMGRCNVSGGDCVTTSSMEPTLIETTFKSAERRLWGLCYHMTGVAADADELVQETFVRALESARGMAGTDLERWLIRVATNLSLDCLRRRKRRDYTGPWLPSPLETIEASDTSDTHAADTAQQVEQAEAISYAFLVALEALSPKARAVLLLVDVLDYAPAEVATILALSEGHVRVLHHRARRTLAGFDVELVTSPDVRARQQHALAQLVICMANQDAAGMAALLTDDVRSLTDGGGRYTALREPLMGRAAVARFHLETARRRLPTSTTTFRTINGVPALVVVTRPLRPQMAPRLVLRCEVDASGRIRELHTILAPRKLTAVRFESMGEPAV